MPPGRAAHVYTDQTQAVPRPLQANPARVPGRLRHTCSTLANGRGKMHPSNRGGRSAPSSERPLRSVVERASGLLTERPRRWMRNAGAKRPPTCSGVRVGGLSPLYPGDAGLHGLERGYGRSDYGSEQLGMLLS